MQNGLTIGRVLDLSGNGLPKQMGPGIINTPDARAERQETECPHSSLLCFSSSHNDTRGSA